MIMVSPTAAATLRKFFQGLQRDRDDALEDAVNQQVPLPDDAAPGDVLYFNGVSWLAVGGTPTEGAVLTIVGGLPTWA